MSIAPCEPLSYDTCAEFVTEFDRLYEGRSTEDYPLNNPMLLNSSSTVHEQSDYKLIFDRAQFPTRYNFPQDPTTGVVSRVFGTTDPDSSQPTYFYLINHASGKALGINGNTCTDGNFIELQDSVQISNATSDFQQWLLRNDGRLESKKCSGMVLHNNWKGSCRNGNELVISEAQIIDGELQQWTFHRDGSIMNKRCKFFVCFLFSFFPHSISTELSSFIVHRWPVEWRSYNILDQG